MAGRPSPSTNVRKDRKSSRRTGRRTRVSFYICDNRPMAKVVAVVGASSDRNKFGNKALRAFKAEGFTVIPINPNELEVEGIKTFPSVLDVPQAIDMATVYVPPEIGE